LELESAPAYTLAGWTTKNILISIALVLYSARKRCARRQAVTDRATVAAGTGDDAAEQKAIMCMRLDAMLDKARG
jgi:hypothetical protein